MKQNTRVQKARIAQRSTAGCLPAPNCTPPVHRPPAVAGRHGASCQSGRIKMQKHFICRLVDKIQNQQITCQRNGGHVTNTWQTATAAAAAVATPGRRKLSFSNAMAIDSFGLVLCACAAAGAA